MIDDIADFDAFGAEFVAFLGQGGLIAGLKRKVVKAAWHAEPAVDARIVFTRHAGYIARFHEGHQLVVAGIKEDVTDLSPFLYLDRIAHHRLETEQVFVELAGFVKVEC